MWDMPGWGTGWMMLIGLAVLVAIVVAVYYGFFSRRTCLTRSNGGALELARRRYARGEITGGEFEEIRKRLG